MAVAATRIFKSPVMPRIHAYVILYIFDAVDYTYVRTYVFSANCTSPITILRETKDDLFSVSCAFVSTVSLRMAGVFGEVIITRVNHEIGSSWKYILTCMQIYCIPPHLSHKLQLSDRTVMKPLKQTYSRHCCNGEKEPKLENKLV